MKEVAEMLINAHKRGALLNCAYAFHYSESDLLERAEAVEALGEPVVGEILRAAAVAVRVTA